MMDGFGSYVLAATIVVPFGGAVVAILLPADRPQWAWRTALVAASLTLAASLYVFIAYYVSDGGVQMRSQFTWLETLGITIKLGVDGLSTPLVLLTGIVMFTGVLVSWNIVHRAKDYFVLFLLLVGGVFGVFAALDGFFFFFFYELAVLPMYLLIGVWGSSTDFKTFVRTKEYGAMKLVLYLVAGSVLVWVALMALFVEAGSVTGVRTFDLEVLRQVSFSPGFQRLFFLLMLLGFGVLAGLWPFHTWSPDGHVAAPTAVSMLHAGVLMKLGAFGIIRLGIELFPQGAQDWMPLLLVLGTVNVVYGAISAMGQRDLKYVVGYSSVSHMGLVLIGLATLNAVGMGGAILQMFSHGIMTALLFATVGVVYDRAHVRDIGVLEGLSRRMGITAALFVVAGLTSLGLPGLSGFAAEFLIFLGLFQEGGIYLAAGVLGIIGAAITAAYILRLLAKVFFGPISEQWKALPDLRPVEGVAGGILVFFLVAVGVVPFPMLRVIDSGIGPLIQRILGA